MQVNQQIGFDLIPSTIRGAEHKIAYFRKEKPYSAPSSVTKGRAAAEIRSDNIKRFESAGLTDTPYFRFNFPEYFQEN